MGDDTSMSYASTRWSTGLVEAQANVNYFDGSAVNLINGLPFSFTSGSTQATVHGSVPVSTHAVIGWGGSAELSAYDLSIAPDGTRRTKLGIYGDADVDIVPQFGFVAGARVDHFKETVGTVVSPRLALRWKPRPTQTVRLAAGKGYRSPSVVESDLYVPSIPVAVLDWAAIDSTLDPNTFPNGFFQLMAAGVCGTRPDNCGAPPGEIPDYVAVTTAQGNRKLLRPLRTRSRPGQRREADHRSGREQN